MDYVMETIYGPVPSWRLGRSLGIDIICSERKICSFDCIYCQLGRTVEKTIRRGVFVELDKLKKDLESVRGTIEVRPVKRLGGEESPPRTLSLFRSVEPDAIGIGQRKKKEGIVKGIFPLNPLTDSTTIEADVVTFSGAGEPTLASNLDDAIELVSNSIDLPIAIITNSAHINDPKVREILGKLDIVVAKLDAPNSKLFQAINRPVEGVTFEDVVEGLKRFRKDYSGKLALQMMFIDKNKENGEEMAALAKEIGPDEIQINTPLRPSPVKPLYREQLEAVEKHFEGLDINVISVYKSEKPKIKAVDKIAILKRRGVAD